MKRSKINQCIRETEAFLDEYKISLPPFCYWKPEQWQHAGHAYDEIRDNQLGWDITDCGLGAFDQVGFSLITLRNGNVNDSRYQKVYAEKLIMLKEQQTFPMHFHWIKSEDIINRGGGTLLLQLYNDAGDGSLSKEPVTVNQDGRSYQVPAGAQVELTPGESITLWPHQYHSFAVVAGSGDVLIGEVSMCNDDEADNRFYEPIGRFPEIEEDEPPYRLLCNEYPPAE